MSLLLPQLMHCQQLLTFTLKGRTNAFNFRYCQEKAKIRQFIKLVSEIRIRSCRIRYTPQHLDKNRNHSET